MSVLPTTGKYLVKGMSQSWNQCLEPGVSKMGYPGMDIHLSSLVVFSTAEELVNRKTQLMQSHLSVYHNDPPL